MFKGINIQVYYQLVKIGVNACNGNEIVTFVREYGV